MANSPKAEIEAEVAEPIKAEVAALVLARRGARSD